MKRYFPLLGVIAILLISAFTVIGLKKGAKLESHQDKLGDFKKEKSCYQLPKFLFNEHISQPIMIDLSQQNSVGIGFFYGKGLTHYLHKKVWERYAHYSTYALDETGNLYLTPMPFISIKPTTFNLQKNLYLLDSMSGKLSIFMHLDDVHPSQSNPYGIISMTYDCDDHTLWVSAIDETDYTTQRGVIYHIDPKTKKFLQHIEGFDALTLRIVHTNKGKFLLTGSANENALYAFSIKQEKLSAKPEKLLVLPNFQERIRKIKILGKNRLELQTIPFSYSLISQSSKEYRTMYHAEKKEGTSEWKLLKVK